MKKLLFLLAITFSTASYSQIPITDANFQFAVDDCLLYYPNGLCFNSNFGEIQDWDVSQVTDMESAFYGAEDFIGDISNWDVSNVTDMSNMFNGASLFNGDLSTWDVSSVTDMSQMFSNATSFNQDISNWDTSKVTEMWSMFFFASDFNGDISAWDTSNVTDISSMFAYTSDFNQNINDWDLSSVTGMEAVFRNTTSFNQPLNDWDVSNVTNMSYMFRSATSFNQNISSWCVTNIDSEPTEFSTNSSLSESNKPVWGTCLITDANFQTSINTCLSTNPEDGLCSDSEYGAMPDWDVSNVTDMSNMFDGVSDFNADISSWDVSNVTNMSYMFRSATSFNQNISSWCVTNIDSEPTEFSTNSSLSESNKPVWGTCPTAGLDDQNQLDISIYPNPTSDIVYVEGNYTQLKVVIYNVLGKEILNKSITNRIDISHLDNGVYILQLSDGVKLSTRKIIKN